MAFKHGDIEPHRKYLAEVPRDVTRKRLESFRQREEAMEALPLVCIDFSVDEKEKWHEWLHPLDPVSLDDLKNWFGVPNEVARKQLRETRKLPPDGQMMGRWTRVNVRNLPAKRGFEFERLDGEQRAAVKQMANNLLYGYADPDEVGQPSVAGVIDYMIKQAAVLNPKLLYVPDLIVCPGDEVVLPNAPAMLFNNVLIYGNGQITTMSHTKIQAHQLRHVNA